MRVACPTCAKTDTFPDADAGRPAVCRACGTSFNLPAAPPVAHDALTADIAAAAETARSFRPQPKSSALGVVLIVLAALFVCIAAVLLGWAASNLHEASRARMVAQVQQLHAEADLLAASGKYREANAKIEQIEDLLSRQQTLTPEMVKIAEDVGRDKRMISEMSGSRPAVAPPAVSTAAPTNPPPIIVPPPSVNPTVQSLQPPHPTVVSPASASAIAPASSHSSQTHPILVEGGRPPIRRNLPPEDLVSDQDIGRSIARAVDHLLGGFNKYTAIIRDSQGRDDMAMGTDILCVYALMHAEQATADPRLDPHSELMKSMIQGIKSLKLNQSRYETYSRAIRATALALYNRPEDQAALHDDAAALMRGTRTGGYTYTLDAINPDPTINDNSNSQYGLLGVWSAAAAGVNVPDSYWSLVQHHWTQCQSANGQWDYNIGPSSSGTHSMTCAGIASLFVTQDFLGDPDDSAVNRALAKALKWLEIADHSVTLDHGAYDLFGVERVGLASGYKYIGNHDWYRELAARAVTQQQMDGSWGDDVDTAYTLLFLSRGRHPILMNKLRFPGNWNDHPRDVANLSRFASHELERQMNWQVVRLSQPWNDWADSPVLYLAGRQPPVLSDADYDKLRSYIENGGLLFMQADGNSPQFQSFALAAAQKLFPQYPPADLPPSHPLYSVDYRIGPIENLKAVSNGARILVLIAQTDLSQSWQMREAANHPQSLQFGTNLFLYAAGRRDLRNRLASNYLPPLSVDPTAEYQIARLKYNGNWDPEPVAWDRFSRWFEYETGYRLAISAIPILALNVKESPIAVLTGVGQFDFSPDEALAIRRYVQSGGVLLIDVTGGTGAFHQSAKDLIELMAFPNQHLIPVSPQDPLLNPSADGMEDLRRPRLRQYTIDLLGQNAGSLLELSAGKGRVLMTPLDITSGLLGTGTWGIAGFEPAYSQSLAKNILLWTLDATK